MNMKKSETTVMIAEDELLVRIGIKSSIDWEKYGFCLILETEDGDETLKKIRELHPNILLLDIKMPGMDGLDILKVIQNENISTKVIIISGLDDFYTVKKAMQLGAYDYIHKPRVGKGELLQVLNKIREEILEDDGISLSNLGYSPQDQFLHELISDSDTLSEEKLLVKSKELFQSQSICFLYASLTGINRKKQKNIRYNARVLYKNAENMITEFCNQYQQLWVIRPKEDRFFFLISGFGNAAFVQKKSLQICEALGDLLRRFMDADVKVGISSIQTDMRKIPEMCGQAHMAWEASFFTNNRVQVFEDIHIADNGRINQYSDLISKMQIINGKDGIDAHLEYFDELCDLLKKGFHINRKQLLYHLQNFLYQLTRQNISLCEPWIEQLEICENIDELKAGYIECIKQYCGVSNYNYSETVRMIINYLSQHYREDLSLSSLAGIFHLNEHYISRIFKEETGENYSYYLNKIRIEEAKKLLGNTDYRIYEIAEKTGFQSHINFNYVFNRMEGISPSSYRKMKGR